MHNLPLMYVHWFERPRPRAEKDINMYKIKKRRTSSNRTLSSVMVLSAAYRFVQLVPDFGPVMDPQLNATTSSTRCLYYWINSFTDKEIYQAVW
jgi:hypothetical protein